MPQAFSIKPAYDNYAAVRTLFDEYTRTPGVVETCYKSYEMERDNLPGDFAEPDGRLYLAYIDAEPAGCIAMRRFDATWCEMKRLFVPEKFRGHGIAEALVEKLITDALQEKYVAMVLTTMSTMQAAQALYKKKGFHSVPAFENDFRENVIYFEKRL